MIKRIITFLMLATILTGCSKKVETQQLNERSDIINEQTADKESIKGNEISPLDSDIDITIPETFNKTQDGIWVCEDSSNIAGITTVTDEGLELGNSKNYLKILKEDFNKNGIKADNFELIEDFKDKKIDGNDTKTITFSYDVDSGKFIQRQIFIKHNGKISVITFTDTTGDDKKHADEFKEVEESIHMK